MDKKAKDTPQFNVLPGAEMGKVVTRFAPEPSGYLHIGHVKAAMLNYYYSKNYQGKMILRFDDTNPTKEKGEYVDNIIKDLKSLEIVPDQITYSSDYFEQFYDYMTALIKEGKAYCDNTDGDTMRIERTEGIKSKNRDKTIEENMAIWDEMRKPNPSEEIKKYCVRGKIDYQHLNKCLRDPVFYRFIDEVHHRLGDKYKLFPCYDFCCPVLDAIEGVTHALRANEYADRVPMYEWVQEATHVRKVVLYEFSRLNLIHTVLSKRNLKWFVDNGKVDGWTDPRFPTVQGIIRRGILPPALKEFCLEFGPSKNSNLMEWDKIYSINRNYIDPIAKRLFAVGIEGAVELIVDDMKEEQEEQITVDWHQKNKDLGTRIQYHTRRNVIEREDAKSLVEGQKLTLYKWGNSLVQKIEKKEDQIVSVTIKLTPEDKNFKHTTIVHWVPMKNKLFTKVILREFDHLITVKKMEDNQKPEDVLNPKTMYETVVYAESVIEQIPQGDKIQLERRGYFYVDQVSTENSPIILSFIPDGKTKSQSIIAGKIDAKALTKGEQNVKEEKKIADKKEKREQKKAKKKEKKGGEKEESKEKKEEK